MLRHSASDWTAIRIVVPSASRNVPYGAIAW